MNCVHLCMRPSVYMQVENWSKTFESPAILMAVVNGEVLLAG